MPSAGKGEGSAGAQGAANLGSALAPGGHRAVLMCPCLLGTSCSCWERAVALPAPSGPPFVLLCEGRSKAWQLAELQQLTVQVPCPPPPEHGTCPRAPVLICPHLSCPALLPCAHPSTVLCSLAAVPSLAGGSERGRTAELCHGDNGAVVTMVPRCQAHLWAARRAKYLQREWGWNCWDGKGRNANTASG